MESHDTTSSLYSLLVECGVSENLRGQALSGDLTGLTVAQIHSVCEWHANACGLHASEVAAIKLQGRIVPYVKAMGVRRFARGKVKRVSQDSVDIVKGQSMSLVIAKVTVETADGTFQAIGCRTLSDHNSLMSASTAAEIRAIRIAVGIPLPSEGEVT